MSTTAVYVDRVRSPFFRRRHRCLFATLTVALITVGSPTVLADEEADDDVRDTGSITDDDGLVVEAAGEQVRLEFTGRFQLRYEFEADADGPEHSSLYFRRIQPNIEGTALSENLWFRLRPDISRDATLRDAWVRYAFSDQFQIQAGQFNVPFNWERDSAPPNQQFVERSAANNEFQWTSGRDVGVMATGQPTDRLGYGIGVFNGQGVNQPESTTTGHVVTGRLSYALAGAYETTEVPVEPIDDVNLAIGAGGFAAIDNTSRDWTLSDQHEFDTPDADIFATTADAHLRWSRLSMHLTGFFRHIDPGDAIPVEPMNGDEPFEDRPSFEGLGWSAHVGALVIPQRFFAALRYGQTDTNLDNDLRRHEGTLAFHLFHREHRSKFQLEAGVEIEEDADDWPELYIARAQYQFLF